MSSVYTHQFCASPATSGGPTTVYTVPPGFLAVIKSLVIVWGDVVISGLDAWFQTSNLTKLARTVQATGITASTIGGTFAQYGTFPLLAGDELQVQTASGTADFFAGGFLLTLP